MDGKEDGPNKTHAHQTDNGEDLEEAEEEEGIQTTIVKNVVVVNGKEGEDPVEPAVGKRGSWTPASRTLALCAYGSFNGAHILRVPKEGHGPRGIDSRTFSTKGEEDDQTHDRVDENGYKGGAKGRKRRRVGACIAGDGCGNIAMAECAARAVVAAGADSRVVGLVLSQVQSSVSVRWRQCGQRTRGQGAIVTYHAQAGDVHLVNCLGPRLQQRRQRSAAL